MNVDPSDTGAWVDPDDAPELTDEMFQRADLYNGGRLIRRGVPPTSEGPSPLEDSPEST
jgi:hypothetical protein